MLRSALLSLLLILAPMALSAQEEPAPDAEAEVAPPALVPMTPLRMAIIVRQMDEEAQIGPTSFAFTFDDVPVTIIYDPFANRMRAMVPIASSEGLSETRIMRLMQANFDSALDARYAVAQGRVWSVFIHPLAELSPGQLVGGVAQTVALAQTYGTTYSSTTTLFQRGDSAESLRELLESTEDL